MNTELPPAVELLLTEATGHYDTDLDLARDLKKTGLLKELKTQAESALSTWEYADSGPNIASGELVLCPWSTINPLSVDGKCFDPRCVQLMSERFARTLGLYADRIVLIDSVSPRVAQADLRRSNPTPQLASMLAALRALEPLLRSGVVSLASPLQHCTTCAEKVEAVVSHAATDLAIELLEHVTFKLGTVRGRVVMTTQVPSASGGLLHDRLLDAKQSKALRKLADGKFRPARQYSKDLAPIVHDLAADSVREALFTSGTARRVNGTPIAGYERDLNSIRALRGEFAAGRGPQRVDAIFMTDVPWIQDLSPQQMVQLRAEAADALPQFRTFMAAKAAGRELSGTAVLELRSAADHVRAELAAIRKQSRWLAGSVLASAGLSFGVCALTPGWAPAVAAFQVALAALGGVHSEIGDLAARSSTLAHSPGYVLVKAANLLDHAP